jgi:hypothetical protein
MSGGIGLQQQMPSTAYTMVATPRQQSVIGCGVGQAQQYPQQQPPQQTLMPGVQMQQQPHVNPMVQNPGLVIRVDILYRIWVAYQQPRPYAGTCEYVPGC